jgi:diacylglycerol O-acyltransferase
MPESCPGDRLTAEDAVFLYLETKDAPLHIGSVSIFDGSIPFEECLEYIDSRLPLIPRYRQRIVIPPFHFGHPTWEADPDFNIRNHVRHMQLKRGSEAELRTFAGGLFSQVMDRNRPLWDMTVVGGLSGGRSALISRVHHCLVDGVSGVGLMNIMLDPALHPRKRKTRHAPPLPGAAASLADALVASFFEMVERVVSAQWAALDVAQALVSERATGALEQLARLVPELLTPLERLPFNQPCSSGRKVAWTEIGMAEMKAIRAACGGTVNDVVLTVVTLAVSRYAQLHGFPLKGRRLRLMVPVNVRREGIDNGLGNRVSALPVSAPLDVRDPVKLLEAIRRRTEALKEARVADLIHLIGEWMGMTPVPLQAAVAPLSSLLPGPPFHMVCTNVPGPQVPLYALGRKMLAYYPYVPIANQMGVGCAIQSYNQVLYVGLTADAAAAPDVGRLRQFMDSAFRELCRASGVRGRPRGKALKVPPLAGRPAQTVRRAETLRRIEKPRPVQTQRPLETKTGIDRVAWIGPVGEGRSESVVAAESAPVGDWAAARNTGRS